MDQTPYHFKFFKGCLPQNLLGPFLNTLTQIIPSYKKQLIYLINWLVSIWEEFGLLISLSYTHLLSLHCVKNVRIWSFPGPHFPAFGLNTEIYEVNFTWSILEYLDPNNPIIQKTVNLFNQLISFYMRGIWAIN